MPVGLELPSAAGPSARADLWPEDPGTEPSLRFLPLRARSGGVEGRQTRPLLYSRSESGRLASYFRALERLFGVRRARHRDLFLSPAPVLFLAVEEALLLYVVVSLVRAALGRPTAGLLFRPVPIAASPRWRCRWKRAALRWLKRCRSAQTLTVLPFSVFPAFSTIADGWIYDVQLWDLTEEERKAVAALRAERQPVERPVLMAIGKQNICKGLDLFADIYARSAPLRACRQFIACGKVEPAAAEHAAVLREAGGVLVDRILSDGQLLGTYAGSDAVWCLYPRIGDHANGILGRAAQLGIPAVVRQGSIAHRLCIVENLPHIAASADEAAERLTRPLPPRDEARGHRAALRFAEHSETTLRAALGLASKDMPAEG